MKKLTKTQTKILDLVKQNGSYTTPHTYHRDRDAMIALAKLDLITLTIDKSCMFVRQYIATAKN